MLKRVVPEWKGETPCGRFSTKARDGLESSIMIFIVEDVKNSNPDCEGLLWRKIGGRLPDVTSLARIRIRRIASDSEAIL